MSKYQPGIGSVQLGVFSPEIQSSLLPEQPHNQQAAAPTEQQMPTITQT